MPLNPDSEILAIIEGCRNRKRDSQHALYKKFYGYGMSITVRYVSDEDEAISIVNDAFMKVFRKVRSYDESRAFKPWFRKIVVNTAINYVTSQKKYRLEFNMDQEELAASRENILSQIAYRELVAVVQSLSVAYRTVFNMYVLDGFSHKEIAEELGISESTSKANLARARAKLREILLAKISV
jgi:RNA polymerase sigma-70 factor (ECF subfamily)